MSVVDSPSEFRRPAFPLPTRCVRLLLQVLARVGIRLDRFDEASLLSAATRATGLSDWGGEDFREPLRILIDEYQQDANLNEIGRMVVRWELLDGLVNRLRIQAQIQRRPEILSANVRRPLFIVGLARTGTTLLHRLLAQDPAHRVMPLWESMSPCPVSGSIPGGTEPRRRAAEWIVRRMNRAMPLLAAAHEMEADSPEECYRLFRNSFASDHFVAFTDIPRYVDWYRRHDMRTPYAYYRRQLQLLQWFRPAERFVLKCPSHLQHLDALAATFPDALIVQTHRDPAPVIASGCSLLMIMRSLFNRRIDPVGFGRFYLESLAYRMKKALGDRSRRPAEQFHDVSYGDLVRDPLEEVRRLYRSFDLDLTETAERNMRQWLACNPQHKRGKHHYDLGQFGLTIGDVHQGFAEYLTQFPLEQAARSTPQTAMGSAVA